MNCGCCRLHAGFPIGSKMAVRLGRGRAPVLAPDEEAEGSVVTVTTSNGNAIWIGISFPSSALRKAWFYPSFLLQGARAGQGEAAKAG